MALLLDPTGLAPARRVSADGRGQMLS